MSRRHHDGIPDARRPRSLRRLWLMLGALFTAFACLGIVGQIERGHRTATAHATLDALIPQQPATYVPQAFLIEYSFEVDGVLIRGSTMRTASQWSSDDRTGIVCYDPSDVGNQILLPPGERCPG